MMIFILRIMIPLVFLYSSIYPNNRISKFGINQKYRSGYFVFNIHKPNIPTVAFRKHDFEIAFLSFR